MNDIARDIQSTSRRRRRQNVAPGVSPGINNGTDFQPSKRAAEFLSPAKAGLENETRRYPGLRELRSLHSGLNSSARYAGTLSFQFRGSATRRLLLVASFLPVVTLAGILTS